MSELWAAVLAAALAFVLADASAQLDLALRPKTDGERFMAGETMVRKTPAWQDTRRFICVVDAEGNQLYSGDSCARAGEFLHPGCYFAKSDSLDGARDRAKAIALAARMGAK